MRLDLPQPLRADHLQALDPVGLAAFEQILQPWQLGLVAGHDDFSAAVGRDALPLAVGIQLALALDTQASFERARRVVDAGVQDATVVAGLVLADARLFVQDGQPQARIAAEKLAADGQAEDPGADHHHVIRAHDYYVSASP